MAKIIALSKTAKRAGLKKGDELKSFDGYPFCDILDCLFYDAQEKFTVEISRRGKSKKIYVEKNAEDPLGLEIDEELSPLHCKNKCQFCFVDQLPKGMRDMLYVKDDDYRYSFISGSYITLTNLNEDDIERILRLKLSPLYVSVHAFDDEVRFKLERNPNTKKIVDIMKRFGEGGIKMHTQIVMVPDLNDGKIMEDTVRNLHGMKGVQTVAVVPVGLTAHREKLPKLKSVGAELAAETIDTVEKMNREFGGFCWCSDEFYIKAGRKIPEYDYYGAFEQIENGVGLVADFKYNLDYALSQTENASLGKTVGFITGESFAPTLSVCAKALEEKLGVKIKVFAVKNRFFGESVTVAGLVTASDILSQVNSEGIDGFIVPSNMLKEFSDVFLDNIPLEELGQKLGRKVLVAHESGKDLIETVAAI